MRHVVKGTVEHEDPHKQLQLVDPAQNHGMSYRQEWNEYCPLVSSWLALFQFLGYNPFINPAGFEESNNGSLGTMKGHYILEQNPKNEQVQGSACQYMCSAG